MKLSGSSDTHDVTDKNLTPEFVLRVAKVADTVWNTGRVTITRDIRATGEAFVNTAEFGLAGVDVNVDDLDVVPTPAVVRYCENQVAPGVVITVSHNPPEFSGVKLVGDDGVELAVEGLERTEDHILAEEFDVTEWGTIESVRSVETANDNYREDLLANVNHEKVAAMNLTVALDLGHGAGSFVTPSFLRKLSCEARTANAQPDGHFSGRQSEPVPENLRGLKHLVRATGTDVEIAHDGDAGQVVFMDERGEYTSGEASLAALAAVILKSGDATVSAMNVSQRLTDICEEVGTDLELIPIGATSPITRVRGLWRGGRDVPVAGEGNGGVFYLNYHPIRDDTYITAKFLELAAECSVSELIMPYEDCCNVHINLKYNEEVELTTMLNAAADYTESADATPSTTGGHRLGYGDAWVLVRPSRTEPKTHVRAEDRSEERVTELAEDAVDALRNAVATLQSV